jgi:hypothetical protein
MANQPPSAGQSLKALSEQVARQLAAGKAPDVLIDQLIQRGWPEVTARQFVTNAKHLSATYRAGAAERNSTSQRYRQQALRGFLWSILGACIAAISFTMCDVTCGFCHFAFGIGLFVVEFLDMCTGLCSWRRVRSSGMRPPDMSPPDVQANHHEH